MAIARILYERSQFDKAIDAYASIPRQSKYFADALQEQAWTFIKAKEWQKAYRALDLLLLANPETTDAPHLRLLMGNLNLRMNNFFLASDAFGKVRDEFEPVHRQLQQVIVKAQADPGLLRQLVGKSLDKFDIAVLRAAHGRALGARRAGRRAHDVARQQRRRDAAGPRRQPEARRAHRHAP